MTPDERRAKARLRSERWRRAHGIGPRKPPSWPWRRGAMRKWRQSSRNWRREHREPFEGPAFGKVPICCALRFGFWDIMRFGKPATMLPRNRLMAQSPEGRQAGDLHRRQPRAEGRRLSSRAATERRHSASRGLAGGSLLRACQETIASFTLLFFDGAIV
jgi:hypothetical protein